jgi:hypothetical protein
VSYALKDKLLTKVLRSVYVPKKNHIVMLKRFANPAMVSGTLLALLAKPVGQIKLGMQV